MREIPARSVLSLLAATALMGMSILMVASASPAQVQATNSTPTYDVATNDSGNQVYVQSIAAAPDGSVYVVGSFNSYDSPIKPAVFGSTSLYNAGGSQDNGYVAKLGPDGVWDWAFRAGNTANPGPDDGVVDVVALDDGGAIVLIDAGYNMTVSPITGSGEFSTTGDTSVLVRVAADGSFVWHKEMKGSIPVSQELSLSADQQTVVALAVNGSNNNVYVEAFNAGTGASIWDRVIQKGSGEFGSTAWQHMELAVNNAGTVVVSFAYYGGTYIVDNITYDSTFGGNDTPGAWHSMFAAFDITNGSTDWVAHTRLLPTNTSYHAEARMFELEPAGDKFLAVVLVSPVNGTVNFLNGSGGDGLQYWGDNRYVVVELSDDGTWAEKTQLPACDGFGCTLNNNYMNLHAADDGSFDLWYFTDQYHSSIAWMDYLHPDDHMVLASFNADGTGEKLTSFTGGNGHRPGWQNAIASFHDGSLVIAGSLQNDLTDGAGNTVGGLTGDMFVAPLDNGSWSYNTPTPPSYTISYDAAGGTGAPADQTCVAGSTVTLSMTEPTRAGYTFTSWTTGGMFPPSYAPGSTLPFSCADTALYAQWEEGTTYTISYDLNGGTGGPADQICTDGSEVTLSTTVPTQTGFTFSHWANSNVMFVTYAPGDTIPCEDQSLYAVWEEIPTYTISYDANGGTGAPASQFCPAGSTVTLSSTGPTRDGYTFLGWHAAADGSGLMSSPVSGVTLEGPSASQTGTNLFDAGTYGVLSLDNQLSAGQRLVLPSSFFADLAAAMPNDSQVRIGLKDPAWTADQDAWDSIENGARFEIGRYDSSDMYWKIHTDMPNMSSYITPMSSMKGFLELDSSGTSFRLAFGEGSDAGDPAALSYEDAIANGWTYREVNLDYTATSVDVMMWGGPLSGNSTGMDSADIDWTALGIASKFISPGAEVPCEEQTLYAQWEQSVVDADDDGLDSTVDPDDTNPDVDGDGVLDGAEQDSTCITLSDCDSDGLTDDLDNDDLNDDQDNDGVLDGAEQDTSCVTVADCDSDGLTDDLDADDLDSDQDDDSVLDGAEQDTSCVTVADCDSDGLTDDLDADDLDADRDNDGVLDGAEQDSSCITVADCDSDGLTDDLDADDLDADQDDDGVLDGAEQDASCITLSDCDADGLADALDQNDLDSDQDDDGIPDGQDPDHAITDTDGDGIPDVSEIEGCENTNDCDNDGVLDGAEEAENCITDTDCDDDGVLDADETAGCATTPDCDQDGLGDADDADDTNPDQDDDGIQDGDEEDASCVAVADCDGDGLTDPYDADDLDRDQDDDGVLDGDETAGCVTVPDCDQDGLGDADDADDTNPDQDDDGIQDGDEEDASCVAVADCDGDGLTDPYDADDLDRDQDDDGVLDGDETAGCVTVPDCDQDGLGDADDADDTNPDQDGDGIQDGDDPTPQFADSDQDGVENTAETAGCELNPDCDNDGLGDLADTDDTNSDQDDDGVQDGGEEDLSCVNTADCDQDGVNDVDETQGCALSNDCDGDTIVDAEDDNDLVRLDNDEEPVVQTTGDFAAAESQGECRSITSGEDASIGAVTNFGDGSVECSSADGEIKIKLESVATRLSGSTAVALQLVAGGQGVASGEGFRPFTRTEIWIASTPTLLKIVEVPASGNWVSVFDVPADLEPGNHTVQAEGLGVDGRLRAASLGVVVEAPPTPTTTTTIVPSSSTTIPSAASGSGGPPPPPTLAATGFAERAPLAVVVMGLALALYIYGFSTWMSVRRKMTTVAPC